jgi:hypothetical protein
MSWLIYCEIESLEFIGLPWMQSQVSEKSLLIETKNHSPSALESSQFDAIRPESFASSESRDYISRLAPLILSFGTLSVFEYFRQN